MKESDLPQSTQETREEEKGEQVYEGCLEGEEKLKKKGNFAIHVGKKENQIKVGRLRFGKKE